MMKSVAMFDSAPQDEDFVLISGNLSDLEINDDADDDLFDENSYDYCEILSLSSIHQTITSTSNPLQVVQENFFVETKATFAPPKLVVTTLEGNSFLGHSQDDGGLTFPDELVRSDNGSQASQLSSQRHTDEAIKDSCTVSDVCSFADKVSFRESTDSSENVLDKEETCIIKAADSDNALPHFFDQTSFPKTTSNKYSLLTDESDTATTYKGDERKALEESVESAHRLVRVDENTDAFCSNYRIHHLRIVPREWNPSCLRETN